MLYGGKIIIYIFMAKKKKKKKKKRAKFQYVFLSVIVCDTLYNMNNNYELKNHR